MEKISYPGNRKTFVTALIILTLGFSTALATYRFKTIAELKRWIKEKNVYEKVLEDENYKAVHNSLVVIDETV